MCFEFAHNCDGSMLTVIDELLGPECYCIISILQLNYVYATDKVAADKLRRFLGSQGIMLHIVRPQQMLHIIRFRETVDLQQFYGKRILLDQFLQEALARQSLL